MSRVIRYLIKLAIAVVVLLPLLPTPSSRVNHRILRYNNAQTLELIITYKHLQKQIK
tara:strand:- start:935 stop:1105 length:171 start_codon:yes stop_codon:yes gene_type:complete